MRLKRWQQLSLLIIYALIITALSLTPAQDMPDLSTRLWDKAQHFIAYAVFMAFAYPVVSSLTGRISLALLIVLYSAAMEYGQSWMPGRAPSGGDLVANTLGVVSAFALMSLINSHLRRRRARH